MLSLLRRLKNRLAPRLELPPVQVRHAERSMLFSMDDEPARPSDRLMKLATRAIERANEIELNDVSERVQGPVRYPDIWPGEHYRLLAALVDIEKPQIVIEIGTAQGHSALALKKFLAPTAKLVTFDITPWSQFADTSLKKSDFNDDRLEQVIADLSDPVVFERYSSLLSRADLLFIDGPKDGKFEEIILRHLEKVRFQRDPLIVFDDIRLWNMLRIWRNVPRPKLDMTSFGHWSGTGWVDWISATASV